MVKKILSIKTKYGVFECVFEPEKDMGGFTAEARTVPGAVSWGRTIAEARRMIAEAVEGAIEASAIVNAERKGVIQIIKNHGRSSFAPVA
ncbi:MAG: type II toxin-antitoxin system HicB family antitoxin [Candidatus Sungbacteria bacterium]|nr:type II toxin-antitoxin system HicB family antitoxin [Candidatus Sungbacteria bacterium]